MCTRRAAAHLLIHLLCLCSGSDFLSSLSLVVSCIREYAGLKCRQQEGSWRLKRNAKITLYLEDLRLIYVKAQWEKLGRNCIVEHLVTDGTLRTVVQDKLNVLRTQDTHRLHLYLLFGAFVKLSLCRNCSGKATNELKGVILKLLFLPETKI